MNTFMYIVVIVISALHFLFAYAYFTNRFDKILMWSLNGKLQDIEDKEGYKKQAGINCIIYGIMFLLILLSLYIVENTGQYKESLYIWFVIMAVVVIWTSSKTRKYLQ